MKIQGMKDGTKKEAEKQGMMDEAREINIGSLTLCNVGRMIVLKYKIFVYNEEIKNTFKCHII